MFIGLHDLEEGRKDLISIPLITSVVEKEGGTLVHMQHTDTQYVKEFYMQVRGFLDVARYEYARAM